MADNKLNLLFQFMAVDKLSGSIKNIVGASKAGSASIRDMQREVRLMEKDLARVNREMAKGGSSNGGLIMAQRELGEAITRTNAEIDRQQTRLDRTAKLQSRLGGIASGAGKAGAAMSLAVTTPMIAFTATSIQASREAVGAVAQVNASLASMGPVAQRSLGQLQDQAGKLMNSSLFDDDEIMRKVTANLLTFGKVTGTTFDRAQLAAVNMATKLDGDLQGATLQVGKALNDPIKGVTALSRAGVSFTASQKEMIKSMVKAGNVAGAQNIILSEMDKQFGGAGAAARAADPGGALAISYGELQQTIGDKLLPVLTPFVVKLTELVDGFGNLPAPMQNAIIGGAGLLAIAGPLLLGISGIAGAVSGLITIAPALGTAFTVATGPIGIAIALVAGAAYLIYRNWGAISGFFQRTWSAISGYVTSNWTTIRNVLLGGVVIFMPFVAAVVYAASVVYRNWDRIKAATTSMIARVSGIVGPFLRPFIAIHGYLQGLVGKFFGFGVNIVSGLIRGIVSMHGAVLKAIINLAAKVGGKFAALLDINSPSRVFMSMGHSINEGLVKGIDGQSRQPVRAVGRMASAVAGAGAMALAPPAATARQAAPAAAPITINITVQQMPGEDSEALARRVAELVQQAQGGRQRRGFGDDF